MTDLVSETRTYVPAFTFRPKSGVAAAHPLTSISVERQKPTFDADDLQQLIPGIHLTDFGGLYAIVTKEKSLYTKSEFAQLMALFSKRRMIEQENSPGW
jgi:hypothetical protein